MIFDRAITLRMDAAFENFLSPVYIYVDGRAIMWNLYCSYINKDMITFYHYHKCNLKLQSVFLNVKSYMCTDRGWEILMYLIKITILQNKLMKRWVSTATGNEYFIIL